ncbi:MAG: hypothetical protein L0154_00885 [Chloroflexi bacterium]|nr:hypothetical protein [Chloroflexota bacterium]
MKKFLLIVIIIVLVACGSSDSDGEIESVNQDQPTAAPSVTPSPLEPTPTIDTPPITSVQLENVPNDLTGHLVLTWGEALFVAPLDGTAVEPVLEGIYVDNVHENLLVTVSRNGAENPQDVSVFNAAIGEQIPLITLEAGYYAQVDKWSPDGQWFTMHINKWSNIELSPGMWSYSVEPSDYALFGVNGDRVELPITLSAGGGRAASGWLTDNTLLVVDSTRLLHVDPVSGDVTELDMSDAARINFGPLGHSYSEFEYDMMNNNLKEYGLELAPVDFVAGRIRQVFAPDHSYRVQLGLPGFGYAGVCGDYHLTQEPIEAAFTTRLLHSGKALRVSEPILFDGRVYYFQTTSLTCSEDDLQIDLMRVGNFENPVIETLYTAQTAAELEREPLEYHLVYDHYLLWSAIEDRNANIFLTDMNTGNTRVLLTAPFNEGHVIPTFHVVIKND